MIEEPTTAPRCPATFGPDCLGFMCLGCGRRVGSYAVDTDEDGFPLVTDDAAGDAAD